MAQFNSIKYSVIIPTLNEEKYIDKILYNIKDVKEDVEIIVTDGGSNDATIDIASAFGVIICKGVSGRGQQFNKGVKRSSGEILIFLHADSKLPSNFFELIDEYFLRKEVKAATFKLKFDINNLILKFYTIFTSFDSLFTAYGDQAIVIRKDFFDKIGGFANQSLFEDVELLKKVRRKTKITKIPAAIITSSRRFEEKGILKTQILNSWYRFQYFLGKDPEDIYKEYYSMEKQKDKTALIIFAKYPEEGKVKTRLAATTGDRFAVNFYKSCASKFFSELNYIDKNNMEIFVFYSREDDELKIKDWIREDFHFEHQKGDNLGERMLEAFKFTFNNGFTKSIIVGTDVPDLTFSLIEEAADKLDKHEVIIGPSIDGGYYMLGMRKLHPQLFSDLEWSSDTVFHETIKRIKENKMEADLLEPLIDIDTEEDLNNWLNDEFTISKDFKKVILEVYLESKNKKVNG